MILTRIWPRNFGPFATGQCLDIQPEVTVITGGNDAGKSYLLRLIRRFNSVRGTGARLVNEEVYFPYLRDTPDWTTSVDIGCQLEFKVGSEPSNREAKYVRKGDVVRCALSLRPDSSVLNSLEIHREGTVTQAARIPLLPGVVALDGNTNIRHRILLNDTITAEEQELLRVAFGPSFSVDGFTKLDPDVLDMRLVEGQDQLNRRISEILPSAIRLEAALQLRGEGADIGISFTLRDAYRALTPLHWRGSGVQKIIGLLGRLAALDRTEDDIIITIDEPENAMHADAQHVFRHFLEALATNPRIQVVYATHSPSMINTLRPQCVKNISRARKDNQAFSVIDNRPVQDNFQLVRTSLGISAADSLLYAPVTLIVEGETEAICLPQLLSQLDANMGEPLRVLDEIAIVQGNGCSVTYFAQVAASQGTKPVVFLDGDKANGPELQKLQKNAPSIPVVMLDPGTEFEEILPAQRYFAALGESLGLESPDLLMDFNNWLDKRKLSDKLAFTRKIAMWLGEAHPGTPKYRTQHVTLAAIKNTPLAEIKTEGIMNLLTAIRAELRRL